MSLDLLSRTPTQTNSTGTSRVKKTRGFVLKYKPYESVLWKKVVSLEREMKDLLDEMKKTMLLI